MLQQRIPMTREKYEEMQAELHSLRMKEPTIANQGWGRESDAEPLEMLEEPWLYSLRYRIQALEEKIQRAEVVSPEHRERVYFGAVVKVKDLERGKVVEYALVGPEEIDVANGRISSASPIGRALLDRSVGDVVVAQLPRGRLQLEILDFY